MPSIADKVADPLRPAEFDNWLQVISQGLQRLGYAVWIVHMDNRLFIDVPRRRLYLLFVSPQLGGVLALRWMRTRLQEKTM